MSNFSFFKGLAVGFIFSAIFWLGVYFVIADFSESDTPTQVNDPRTKIMELKAEF